MNCQFQLCQLSIKREPKFDPQKAKANEVPQRIWGDLQRGQKPVEYEGKTYTPDMVLGEARKGMRVSWVTDTRPTPEIPGFIEGSDLLLSCANFGSNDDTEKAKNKMHMTFAEAATQAKKVCEERNGYLPEYGYRKGSHALYIKLRSRLC